MAISEVYLYRYLKELEKGEYHIVTDNIKIPMPNMLMEADFPIAIMQDRDSTIHVLHNQVDIISFVKEKCNPAMELEANYEEYIEQGIAECLRGKNMILTKRVLEGLKSVIDTKIQIGEFTPDILAKQIKNFIEKPDTLSFISDRQPELSKVPDDVIKNLQNYFKENLKAYEVVDVCRKSNHPDDCNLYSVIARRKDDYYTCWTSWNDKIKSLNHGHYGLNNKEEALIIIRNNYHDITGDTEKYGIENSRIEIGSNMQEKEQNYDNIIFFRTR